MQPKLDHMRTFVTVAQSGSLNEAAKILNRTPSAISMSLKQFAQILGDNLFETDRKSKLTPFGYFVFERSRDALKDFDQSLHTISRFSKGNFGTVRVAAVPSIATRLLPQVVKGFMANSPKVRFELRDMDSDSVNNVVRDGIVDFGIASHVGAAHDLQIELLLEEPFGVVCHREHRFAGEKKPIKWQQLKETEFISNGLCRLVAEPRLSYLSEHAVLHIHNTVTLLSFIEQGFGLTLLPRMAVPENGNLRFRTLEDQSAVRQLYILQHPHRKLNPAAKEFKDQVKASAAGGVI